MELDVLESDSDRRSNKFRFDKNINISAVIGALILLGAIWGYGRAILSAQEETNQKVNIMWKYFIKDKPELNNFFPD